MTVPERRCDDRVVFLQAPSLDLFTLQVVSEGLVVVSRVEEDSPDIVE